MSDQSNYPGAKGASPLSWLMGGIVCAVIGGIVAAESAGGEAAAALLLGVGGILLTIGAVAKGVEVGIRHARD